MDSLRKQIRKELRKLMEGKNIRNYPAPPEIVGALKKLFPGPLVRYIENLKSVNTIPPSYRVFLREGGKYFDLYFEKVSIVAKIGAKEYWLMNDEEVLLAQQELNRLLVKPTLKTTGEEETEDSGGSSNTGGSSSTSGGSEDDTAMETEPEEEEPTDDEPTI
jgi:hypothetical protein